jgi:polyferredoxin
MWSILGSAVDVLHALLMAFWVLGLPLLFVRRWPQASRAYGIYAIAFIVLSQASEWILGECFLTSIAGRLWNGAADPVPVDASEWFTVRLAKWVFDMAPSHRSIVIASEALIFATAIGVLVNLRQGHPTARAVKAR